MPESRFFQIPGRTGLLFAALIAVVLCMLAHGKDFRVGQLKRIKETLQINWRKILFQAILIVGVVLGMSYTRFLDRIASVISMKDIYFYISGTGALAGTQVLENIAERFSILVTFHEPDLLIIPISFLVFELLAPPIIIIISTFFDIFSVSFCLSSVALHIVFFISNSIFRGNSFLIISSII